MEGPAPCHLQEAMEKSRSTENYVVFFFLTFLPQGLGALKRFAKKVKRLGRDIAEVKKGTANTVS